MTGSDQPGGTGRHCGPLDSGQRTRATFTLDFIGQGAADVFVPLLRRTAGRAAPRSYARLKAMLETAPDTAS